MSDHAFEWENCKYHEIMPSDARRIVERHVDDEELLDEIVDDLHGLASSRMMARGRRRAGAHFR